MAGLLELMSAAGGAIALIDRIAENPKGRERTLDSLRLELVYANADAVSNDWLKRMDGRKRAEKVLAAIKRKIAALRRAGQWDERFTDYYLGKQTRDDFAENPKMRFPVSKKSPYADRLRAAVAAVQWMVENGSEFPDAEAKMTVLYNVKSDDVRAAYDRHDNPRSRSKRGVTRPSQITKRAPTKRLVKRRKATAKAPRGFFANPVDVNDLRSEGTYTRVTKPMLQNKLVALSKALRAPQWPARGAIGLDMAFNGYRLVQITEGTAEQDLSPRLKTGEMANFLDGALMVAKAVK